MGKYILKHINTIDPSICHCGQRFKVTDSRHDKATKGLRRRKKCLSCGNAITTYELSRDDLKVLYDPEMLNLLERLSSLATPVVASEPEEPKTVLRGVQRGFEVPIERVGEYEELRKKTGLSPTEVGKIMGLVGKKPQKIKAMGCDGL